MHQTYALTDFTAWFTDCGGTGTRIEANSTRCCALFWYRWNGNERGWRAQETLEFNDDNGHRIIVHPSFTFLALPGNSSSLHENPTGIKIISPSAGAGKIKN
jgi:hypothetical protein